MDRPEAISLLRHAHDEVLSLRRRVAELEPKAHAYDTLAIIARQSVHPEGQGYGIDVAWRLKSAVEKLEAERAAQGIETEGQDAEERLDAEHESPVAEGDAPNPLSEPSTSTGSER